MCYALSWFITAVAFVIYYRKSHWLEKRIDKLDAAKEA
jgi:hypothetical protein